MAIAPRLELRQTQSLALTPQMQQAIRLLRMNNLELAEFVAEEAEKNPLLEVVAPTRPQSAPSTVGQAGGGGDRRLAVVGVDEVAVGGRVASRQPGHQCLDLPRPGVLPRPV